MNLLEKLGLLTGLPWTTSGAAHRRRNKMSEEKRELPSTGDTHPIPPPDTEMSPVFNPEPGLLRKGWISGGFIVGFWNLLEADFLAFVLDNHLQTYDRNAKPCKPERNKEYLNCLFKLEEIVRLLPIDEIPSLSRRNQVFQCLSMDLRLKYPRKALENSAERTKAASEPVAEASEQDREKEPIGFKPQRLTTDAIECGRKLKPIVESLYKLTMKEHPSLKSQKAEDCLQTALAVFDDAPKKYEPITRDDLTLDLFNMDPSHSRRDFVSRLLQKLLQREGFTVPNLQDFYDELIKK